MAYDESKDKELKSWKHEGGLWVSVYQYNGSDPKVQIGPREYTKKDGEKGFGKAGRLTMAEMGWLFGLKDVIKAVVLAAKK